MTSSNWAGICSSDFSSRFEPSCQRALKSLKGYQPYKVKGLKGLTKPGPILLTVKPSFKPLSFIPKTQGLLYSQIRDQSVRSQSHASYQLGGEATCAYHMSELMSCPLDTVQLVAPNPNRKCTNCKLLILVNTSIH